MANSVGPKLKDRGGRNDEGEIDGIKRERREGASE
jgi:hypothetical protein